MIDVIADSDPPASRLEKHRPSVDDMSEWSFPASDPPATWTWDVDEAGSDRSDDSVAGRTEADT